MLYKIDRADRRQACASRQENPTRAASLAETASLKSVATSLSCMIRIVWGTGTAETRKASFDEALAAANVHQYNLRELSSVIPAAVELDICDTAPDLGPTGQALDAVVARQTSQPGARAVAGLAWTRTDDGSGIFYEVEDHDRATVRERLHQGIEHGCRIRDIEPAVETKIVSAAPAPGEYATAAVLAVYGESEPLV
jgi:arginine decarboxylase